MDSLRLRAQDAALSLGHDLVTPEHLFLALLDPADESAGSLALRSLGLSADAYTAAIERHGTAHPYRDTSSGRVEYSLLLTEVIARAHGLALGQGDGTIRSEHVVEALLWVEQPGPIAIQLIETEPQITRQQIADALAAQGAPIPNQPLPRDVFMQPQRLVSREELKDIRAAMEREGIRWGAQAQGDKLLIIAERWPDTASFRP